MDIISNEITTMKKRKVRIAFVDSWEAKHPEGGLIYRLLKTKYDVELSDKPDYLFVGNLGEKHRKYSNCIKIECCGENVVPDFNAVDYAIGFDYLTFGDRYQRIPLYAFYSEYEALLCERTFNDAKLLSRDFCSFVVSNGGGNPLRKDFFEALSKYKKVSSGGRYLNNIELPEGVKDKCEFCSGFKFNIAFENSDSLGYTTEKIIQPLAWKVVPIYWGNPLIKKEINEHCFIHLQGYENMEEVIEQIIFLDQNDDEYLKVLKQDCFVSSEQYNYKRILMDFLDHIISQPINLAHRLNKYGHQATMAKEYAKCFDMIEKMPRALSGYYKFKKLIHDFWHHE